MAKNETAAAETVAAAPRTLQEQLEAAQARVDKIKAAINTQEILQSVKAGDTATFTYGRAEKVRELSGTVVAVGDRTDERGRATRIAVINSGEGLDIEQYKVRVADILTLNGEGFAGASVEDEAPADDAAPEAPEADADAGEDPFAS